MRANSDNWDVSLVRELLDRSVILSIGLMLALLGFGAFGSYRSIESLRRNAEWLAHTRDVDHKASNLTRSILDSALHARGYCLHGESVFQDRAMESIRQAEFELQDLRRLTSDNSEQQIRIQSLQNSIPELKSSLQSLMNDKTEALPAGALASKDSQLDNDLNATLLQVSAFRSEESQLLLHREDDLGSTLQTTLIFSVVLFGLGLIVFTGTIELIRRNALSQQQRQTSLSEARKHLAETLNSIENAVVTLNTSGEITQWNLPSERLTGVSQSEALGQRINSILELADELTGQPARIEVENLLRSNQPSIIELVSVIRRGDRLATPVAIRIRPVQSLDNEVSGAVVAIQELNELRQSEIARTERARVLALRADIGLIVSHAGQTNQQLQDSVRTICEKLSAAAATIWIVDTDSDGLIRAAGACSEGWGLHSSPASVAVSEWCTEIVCHDQVFRGQITTESSELNWNGAEDAPPLFAWALPLTIEEQSLGLLIVYTLKPLTDLTSSELSLVGAKVSQFIIRRRTEEKSKASEEMFRTLANSISQLAWMARPDGYIFWYNQRWYDYTGTTLEQMQGWGWQSVHDPNELPHVLTSIKHSFDTGEPWEDTFPLRRHDGEFRWHLSRMLPVKDDQGRIRLWFGTNTDVTEQRSAEQRLRRVIDSMFSFVGILSEDGTLIEANQAPLVAAGVSREEVIGLKFWDCPWWNYREEVRNRLRDSFQRALLGEWVRYDEEIQVKDNQRITIDFQLQPVFDQGKILFVIPSGVDVTSRRRAEERLLASERFLNSVLNGLASHIAVLDENGVILMVNDAWKKFADHNGLASSHYSVGQNYLEVCAPASSDCPTEATEAAAGIRSVLQGKQPWFEMEYPCHSPTEQRWFQMRVDRLLSPDSLRVVVSHENITARVVSEEATRSWSEQHRRLAEIALQLSASISPDEILESAARGARSLIQSRASESVLWNTQDDIELLAEEWDPSDAVGAESLLVSTTWMRDRVHQTNQPLIFTPKIPLDLNQMDSSSPVGCLAVPLVNQSGLCIGSIRICSKIKGDFSEDDEAILVQLAQMASVSLERSSLYEKIRNSDERKDQFLAMLAHELRNPLSAISSATQLLQLVPDNVEQVRSTSELALRQCDHLKQLVDDLLDVSRISRGKLNIRQQVIRLQDVLQHAMETSEPSISAGRHILTVDVSSTPIFVNGDSVRLAQAVSNLLVNAAKYTPAGGQISLRLLALDSEAQIIVRDNGIGIPARMLEQVFEIFTQVDASHSRSQGGLGIGLSLAKNLVLMHGGTIHGTSEGENKGSTFTIRLPTISLAHEDLQQSSADDAGLIENKRILVVDDNRAAVHLLGKLLSTLGHEVQTTHDGQTALQMIPEFLPDVVISDIGMPDMSGYELASQIQQLPGIDLPTLIALTGYGRSEDRQTAFDAGFRFHLTKPVSLAELKRVMRELSLEA